MGLIKSLSWRRRRNRTARNLKILNPRKRSSQNKLKTQMGNQDRQETIKSQRKNYRGCKKNIKDVKPNKVQGELRKLAEKIEKNSLLSDATGGYTNGVDGIASAEASAIKSNFDALQKDYESRTGEIEKLTSQLSRAKADSNSAVEKLRRSESELSQIKEKNAQLSDELLNKSRRIAGLENGGGGQDTAELQR